MYEIISYGITAVAAIICGFHLVRWLDKQFRRQARQEPETHDLNNPITRARLTSFLASAGIGGSAEIRDGVVYLMHEEQAHPLAIVFGNAAAFANRLKNPDACSLYIRDSVNDRFLLLSDLDLDHIREAAQMLRRVAAEKGAKK